MADIGSNTEADGDRLRGRLSAKSHPLHNVDDAKHKVLELNDQEDRDRNDDKQKRTYGRTPDGTGKFLHAVR